MGKKKVFTQTKALLVALFEAYGELCLQSRRWHSLDRVMHPEYYEAKERDRREREARRALRALRTSKMIAVRKKGVRILFALTDKGRLWILQHQCQNAPLCANGECIMVIFDIPEAQKSLREQFRRFLSEHRFRLLQKSVWMTEYDVLCPLQEFVSLSGAKPWVHVFRARGVKL